ncbi:MAG: selenocysteine-specific translation elongation factor [Pseudonocardiaceae bacterium]|nr:selenocysteine-specific translation elongation factor [Pseudonocardiaceae bacterium]
MHVIATAGHVDHGKSTLVRALTGMEPDRWEIERRRGLTVGLGFGWLSLGGHEIAFVDVPGHDGFVPTMLAGVGPVPAVLFVVAADEGWMPQSEEHLAALDAFDVRHGVLVVTRADLADPEPARRQALARIARSSLGEIPSVPVSARTGTGLDALGFELTGLATALPAADADADLRLWVDRSFSISGAGTVATGTLAAGTLRTGDELVQHSSGARLRVRGLQALNRSRESVAAVARVAVNLRGVRPDEIRHGDALLTPDSWLSTTLVDVGLREPAEIPAHLTVHIGSASVPARVRPLGASAARLRLDRALPLRVGDRLLLRDPGRHVVVASARALDVRPAPLNRRGAARALGADLAQLAGQPLHRVAEARLRERGPVRGSELHAMGLPAPGTALAGDWYVDAGWARRLAERLTEEVDAWQRAHPLADGMPTETVRRKLELPDNELIGPLAGAAGLMVADGVVRAGERQSLPDGVRRAVETLAEQLRKAPFAAPDARRLAELGLGSKELAAAVRAGRLHKIADGVVVLPDALSRARETLTGLSQPFTLSQARKALGTTRRVAVPLLESLDRAGFTERLPDDTRRLR